MPHDSHSPTATTQSGRTHDGRGRPRVQRIVREGAAALPETKNSHSFPVLSSACAFTPVTAEAAGSQILQIEKFLDFFFAASSACTFTATAMKVSCASEIKINAIYFVFRSACTTFTATAMKVGGASEIKTINYFVFPSACTTFTTTAMKVGGASEIKTINCFVFRSACTTFAKR